MVLPDATRSPCEQCTVESVGATAYTYLHLEPSVAFGSDLAIVCDASASIYLELLSMVSTQE